MSILTDLGISVGVQMEYEIKCSVCGKNPPTLLEFKCPSCGNALSARVQADFDKARIKDRNFSLWRYANYFPYVGDGNIVTLGEGWTPLVRFSDNILFKLENSNPTGSFKDRGSTVLISALHKLVKAAGGYICEDSSGNAGASVAAYAARAELKAKIYVPDTVTGPKLNQIQFYGAEVTKLSGSRSAIAEAAQASENKKFYVGHILHPLFRDGIRTLAYEIAEQMNWRLPDRVYIPVSAGTLLLGITEGFAHLLQSKAISSIPTIIACQTNQVSPLYYRLKNINYAPPLVINSVADALLSVNPPLLELMIKELNEAKGDAVMVEEDEIVNAFEELAKRGFFVEPSSAVAYAAFKKQVKDETISKKDKIVIVMTGSGLKTTLKPHGIRI
jgi:threonine synthase